MTGPRRRKELHAGSLLRIPLVARMLADPGVTFVRRAVDLDWKWREAVEGPNVTGFRPFFGEVLYAAQGGVAKWMASPDGDARDLNVDDALVRAVLFMVHDYLHGWAYARLRELSPRLQPGYGRIRPEDIEDLVFLHLLTEAVATVGLDYWYLCTVHLNDVCDLGTRVSGLTVGYHEDWASEARRAAPDFRAQSPAFFEQLATFYATGELVGFDADDLRRSPRLHRWLRHEITYGRAQRIYARQWLRYIAGLPPGSNRENEGPVDTAARWKRTVLRKLGGELWAMVKEGKASPTPRAPAAGRWASPIGSPVDFRFVNAAALDREELDAAVAHEMGESQFEYFCAQYVAVHDLASFDEGKLRFLELARRAGDAPALVALFEGERRVPREPQEPRDVMFLG